MIASPKRLPTIRRRKIENRAEIESEDVGREGQVGMEWARPTEEEGRRGGLEVRPRSRRAPGSKHNSTEDLSCIGPDAPTRKCCPNLVALGLNVCPEERFERYVHYACCFTGRGGLVARSRLWVRRVPRSKPLKIRRVWGMLHARSYVVANRPPVDVTWKFGEGVPF
ncbi:hypothetical protein AVEN_215631-1 [Araneus ventricosus]|uniref:Uncharacterized protein n=1 Tax=Araneus ventricosus TaxID=182803 RepID=A0A4Y2QED7_ARAVE|nr:hypothetical protein AVEN_215631-1 [Araneus ventricosus]